MNLWRIGGQKIGLIMVVSVMSLQKSKSLKRNFQTENELEHDTK